MGKIIFGLFFRVIFVVALLAALLFFVLMFTIVSAVEGSQAMTGAGMIEDESGDVFVSIIISGTVGAEEIDLTVTGPGIVINGIKGDVSLKKGTKATQEFSASNDGSGETSLSLPPSPPASLTAFSWMPQFDQSLYSYHLDHESDQYKFNQGCVNDSEGFRRHGDYYLVALGTYYGSAVGEKYNLTFTQDDGSSLVIRAVRGDTKSDSDTDANHQYHLTDGSVVEFIMAERVSRNSETINDKFGTLASISKGSMIAVLTGTIDGDVITLSGTIDGYPVTASGTVKEGKISATGYYGSGAGGDDAYPGEPLTDENFNTLMAVAMAQLGKPYVFGAVGPSSFDCSGYVMYCFKNALDKAVPRTASAQQQACTLVNKEERQPGDLVFFQGTYKGGVSHVGIYIGNDHMIHAGGSEVHYTSLSESYYITHFHSYGRVE
jgi:cell wall-associated NlpC family hydrolase